MWCHSERRVKALSAVGMPPVSRWTCHGLPAWAACGLTAVWCLVLALPAHGGTTWDGGGVNTNFTTGANWNDDSAPSFTGGTSTLTFATGGSTATVDTAASLARIILNSDSAFTVADGSGSLTLAGETIGGVLTGITASPATAGTTVAYTISEQIALGATQSWNVANNGAGGTSLSVSGVISGASLGLTKIGSGTLTLSGVNTFSGTMSINEGTVSVGSWNNASSNGVWGNAASLIQMNGGRINYTGASASGNLRGMNLASGTNTIDVASGATLNFTGFNTFQSNGGNLVKEGAGTLQLGSPGVANNIFAGKATINSGTLDWFGGGSMPNPASLVSDFLTINNGAAFALSYSDAPTTVSANIGIRLAGNATIMSGTASGASHTIAGPIADGATAGSLQKTGPGRLTLSASNSFTGSTRSVTGTLTVNNASALASSTLDMNGADSGSVTFSQNSTLGGLTGSRNLDMSTHTLSIGNNGQSTTYSGVLSNGGLTKVGSGTLALSGVNTFSGTMSINEGTVSVGSWNNASSNGVWGNAASLIQMNGGRINYTGASASGNLRGMNLASGTNTIDVASGATLNFTGFNTFQSNGGNLVKEGAGTLQLGSPGVANNIFAGKATINSGTLDWFGGGSMPNPASLVSDFLTINNGAAFALSYSDAPTTVSANIGIRLAGNATIMSGTASGASHTIAGPIADGATAGSLQKTGLGTLTLSATNTYSGNTTISAGRLTLGGNGVLGSGSYAGTIANAGELVLGSGAAQILSGVISGTGSVTKSGAGTLTLSAANTYAGNTTLSAGRLVLGGSGVLGSGSYAGTIANAGELIFGSNAAQTLSGGISGTGSLTQLGSGTLALSGNNSFSGLLTVANGALSINSWNSASSAGPLGGSTANFVLGSATSAGTLRYTGGNNYGTTRGFDLAAGGGVIQLTGTARNGGFVHIAGSLISGSGQLTINNPGMVRFLLTGGSSGFSGPVRVQAGELQGNVTFSSGTYTPFGTGSNGLGSAITVDSGAILTLYGGSNYIGIRLGSLAGSGTVTHEGGTYNLLVGGDDTSTTFSGVIGSGANISLTKVGSGTLTLSGSNSYAGNTTLSAGRLVLGGSGLLGSGSYAGTIANAGELIFGSNAAQTLSGGISGTGSLTQLGSGTLALSGNNSFSGLLTVANGALSINSWNSASTNGPLGNSAASVVLGSATSSGMLVYTGGNSNAPTTLRGIDLAAGGGAIQMAGTGRDSGYVHIAGSRISGSGQLTINNPGMARLLIVGSSTFSGPVTVQAGELQINMDPTTTLGSGSNGLGSAVTVNSGALLTLYGFEINSRTLQIGSLAGAGIVRSEGGGTQTLSVGGDGTSTTFSGAIGGGSGRNAIALTKVGAGTLTLGGSSAYTGATQIAAGALLVNGTLGATAVTVQSGGLLGGSGLIGGSVSVLAGGTFSPGNSPGLLTSGPLSLAGTTLMEIDGLAPRGGVGGYDAANINGLLTYGGSMLIDFGPGVTSAFADNTAFSLFSFTSRSNSFSGISTASDGSFYAGLTFTNSGNNDKWTATKGSQTLEFTHSTGSLVIVPEPAAIALALSGIALGAGLRWRRRRAA